MTPNLRPGDEVVATSSRAPGIGDIVVFEHPDRDGFWMVKRMAEPPRPIGRDEAWVVSDNTASSDSDSRRFGPVPLEALMPVVTHLDAETFLEAVDLLIFEDAALAAIVDRHGTPVFWEREPGFPSLAWLILEQQVSLESGAEMFRRLIEATGGVTPEAVARLGVVAMREIGVTRQKAGYLHEIATSILDGELDLDGLGPARYEDGLQELLSRRGIGPWTADAYLLSAVRHPDVFPVGDRALQVGVGEALGMRAAPDPKELEILAQPWRPVRAAAARLIWHDYLSRRGRVEPKTPGP